MEPALLSILTLGHVENVWWQNLLDYVVVIVAVLAFLATWLRHRERMQRKSEEARIRELRLNMFTDMTHEIRTPLTLVMGPLKKLRETEQSPRMKETYNLMYRNCIRINRIVEQLMDIRKIDEGKLQLHFVETDIVYFIQDIMLSFKELSDSKHVGSIFHSEDEVEKLWIDQSNFDKVIFNILSNAFKFTPEHGNVKVSVSKPQPNHGKLRKDVAQYVQITVHNTGSHLDDKDASKIFDRFYQTGSVESRAGSGVGLNLSKTLTDLHHGTLEAVNADGGVSFIITLPAGNAHLTRNELSPKNHHADLYVNEALSRESYAHELVTPIQSQETEKEQVKVSKNKKTLVVVDDDKEMRDYLHHIFSDEYNVEAFSSCVEAWPQIITQLPDAVITDLLVPVMDGLELCAKIRHNPQTSHIPVLVLTSQSDEQSMQRGSDAGADRFLVKPVSEDLLQSSVTQMIAMRVTMRSKYTSSATYDYDKVHMDTSRDQLLDKVLEIIRREIGNTELNVEQISREVGMSRVNLNRRLKDVANTSPSTLIRSVRLKQAAYLLINNKVNISEVAYKVGFTTHSYFSSSFHDYYGMSPKDFVAKYMNCTDEETLKKLLE